MSVKKKSTASIDNFISKGADVKSSRYSDFRNILIRVPVGVLQEVDKEIQKKPWVNRTQWIVEAIHEKLTREDNDGVG